jgi:hypothetical protein
MGAFPKIRGGAGKRGFVLFEAMVATAIFAIAVIGLARCVEAGLTAGLAQREDSRARRALLNWMIKVQANVPGHELQDKPGVKLGGEFTGFRLYQSVIALELEDQNKQKVDGIFEVNLELVWNAGGGRGSKRMKFYACPSAL